LFKILYMMKLLLFKSWDISRNLFLKLSPQNTPANIWHLYTNVLKSVNDLICPLKRYPLTMIMEKSHSRCAPSTIIKTTNKRIKIQLIRLNLPTEVNLSHPNEHPLHLKKHKTNFNYTMKISRFLSLTLISHGTQLGSKFYHKQETESNPRSSLAEWLL